MATVTRLAIGSPFPVGAPQAAGFSTFTLDSSTDKLEYIFQAPEAITVTHLWFRYGLRTGTPPTYRISLQGVDGTGIPDGIIKAGTNAFGTFTPPADTSWNSSGQWIALTSSYTCARGDILAIVLEYSTGTIDVSNNSSFTGQLNGITARAGLPYVIQNDAGSRTRQGAYPSYGYKSSTTSYGTPWHAYNETNYASDSNPNEYALAFSLPGGPLDTFTVSGCRANIRTPAAGKTFVVRLYDGTTVLQDITFDGDQTVQVGGNRYFEIFFDTPLVTLTCGTTYYLAFAPQETAANLGLSCYKAASAQDIQSAGGDGNFYLATRNGGAWTPDTTQRPFVELLLADITRVGDGYLLVSN